MGTKKGTMCGYCTEQLALNALHKNSPCPTPDDLPRLNWTLYLQEVRDFPKALRHLATEVATAPPVASAIMCRAIEILVAHGFESEVYQDVLEQPQFVSAIHVGCKEGMAAQLNDFDTNLKASHFAWLAETSTYLLPDYFERRNRESSSLTSASLLNNYIDWRLDGEQAHHQKLDQMPDSAGVMDAVQDVAETEQSLLNSWLPALWFSLLRISCLPAGEPILFALITRNPSGTPDFYGFDLWLQRRAALVYYDQKGANPFLVAFQSIREELFQFLGAARNIDIEERMNRLKQMTEPPQLQ